MSDEGMDHGSTGGGSHVTVRLQSPTAGPSDIARPNPLAQVSDTASQGPDSAPGPSTATHVPPSSGPSHHDVPSSSEFVSARVGGDEWEHVRAWSRRVSSPDRHQGRVGTHPRRDYPA